MAGGDRGDRCATVSILVAQRALNELGLLSPDVRRRLRVALRFDDDDDALASQAVIDADRAVAAIAVIDEVVGDDARDAFAERWCALHPTLRGVAALAATPLGWLDLCWRTIDALHPFATHTWRSDDEALSLRVVATRTPTSTNARPSPWSSSDAGMTAWFRWMDAVARHAPAMIGAAALRPVRVVVDAAGLDASYAMTSRSSAAARVGRATGVPLHGVLATLAALPGDVLDDLDGVDVERPDAPGGGRDPFAAFARRHGLTAAEARVVARLCEGLAPAEIARTLGIATGTVRVHLKHAYRKTGARGQRALSSLVEGAPPTGRRTT